MSASMARMSFLRCLRSVPTAYRLAFSTNATNEQLEKIVNANKIVLFMKGVRNEPMCGFSKAVIQIFDLHGVENFNVHNILEEGTLREDMKAFSGWPTFPQVYFNGELVGGCDILLDMHKSGELVDKLKEVGVSSKLEE